MLRFEVLSWRGLSNLEEKSSARLPPLIPGAQIRPLPSLDLGNPEVQVIPDRERASKVGLNASEIGQILDVLLDGTRIDDYIYQGDEIDLVLKGKEGILTRTQDFDHVLIHTQRDGLVPLNSVSRLELVSGPSQINHLEQQRAIVIRIIPSRQTSPWSGPWRLSRNRFCLPYESVASLARHMTFSLQERADDLYQDP